MINKLKMLGAVAAVVLAPLTASAATIVVEDDYATALSMVNPAQSLDLPAGASWTDAPLTVSPDASLAKQYRSPFEADGFSSAGYYAVGGGATYAGTSNPAILTLSDLATSISLFWGSSDDYNSLELLKGGSVVATILGSQISNAALAASFVTITADNAGEFFDSVKFSSLELGETRNAFEFSNVAVAAIPVPATGLLLVGALGALGAARRRKKAA